MVGAIERRVRGRRSGSRDIPPTLLSCYTVVEIK